MTFSLFYLCLAILKLLASYYFIRLFFWAIVILATSELVAKKILSFKNIAWIFSFCAVAQSIIAFFQFKNQSSIGLHWLGESILHLGEPGIANIVVDGVRILRGYGTFPHPNVLAAFLVVGLISLCYLFLVEVGSRTSKYRAFLSASLFIVLFGLVLTGSRSAWLVAFFAVSIFLFSALKNPQSRRSAIFLWFILLAIGYTLVAILGPFLFSRTSININEPAFSDRLAYNKLGLEIILQHPFGVGSGNQVSYASQNKLYEKFGLTQAWQKQPVHNLYILIASEIGILGLLAFLVFIYLILRNAAGNFTPQILLGSLLMLGIFDHYLWDIWDGQLLLAITIGIVMGIGARSSMDRAQPSEG